MKKTWKILVSEVGYARIITPYAAGIFCTLSFLQTSNLITYVGVFVFFSAIVYNVFLIKRFHFLNRRKEKWKKINLSGRKIVLKDFVKINSNVLYGTGRRKGYLLYMVMIYKNKGKATLYTRRVEHKDRIFEEHFFDKSNIGNVLSTTQFKLVESSNYIDEIEEMFLKTKEIVKGSPSDFQDPYEPYIIW